MSTADADTLALYDAQAREYVEFTASPSSGPGQWLTQFIAALPEGGSALDLGCGPGRTACLMTAAGLQVEATDASAGMVAEAARAGVNVRLARFDELSDEARFDGIWASYSLLHAPRAAMPDLLARIARALRPKGALYLGMKTGEGEARDRLGRIYTYYTVAELTGLLDQAGFAMIESREGAEKGMAGTLDPLVGMLCRKRA